MAKLLLAMPWQISAVMGGIALITLRWLLPAALAGNPFLPAIKPLLNLASLAVAGIFCLLAIGSTLKSSNKAAIDGKSVAPPPNTDKTNRSSTTREPLLRNDDAQPIDNRYAKTSATDAPSEAQPTAWTLETLRALEWKRFELLCAKYYEMVGFKAETLRCGPDGGIDVKLFKNDPSKPLAIVQCKAWNGNEVGVKEIRELLGVMTHEKVERGIFVTTSTYTKDAASFGASSPIQLLDGEAFVEKILALPQEQQKALLDFAYEGDYRTPTCPSCGVKMVRRKGKRGEFFGCLKYPRCRRTFAV